MSRYLWSVLAGVLMAICVAVSRALRLPIYATMPLSLSVRMLAMFPFLKKWMPKTTFTRWTRQVLRY